MFLCGIIIWFELKIRGKVFSNGLYEALIELRDLLSKLDELKQQSKWDLIDSLPVCKS